MSYATLMLYVDADSVPEQRVRLAAHLTDKFSATLIGFSALGIRPPLVTEGAVVAMVAEAELKEMRATLASKGNWFRNIAGAEHRKIEWRSALDFPTEALAREARNADLIMVGQSKVPGNAYSLLDPGAAILKIGRPVLVVPEGLGSLRAEHVVIGWKDTREARRAVQDALPFLHNAGSVAIVGIYESDEVDVAQKHIDDVANYLGRHKIEAGPKITVRRKGSDAAQLIRIAQDAGADLLVTGAYGHSRLGEWIFGGMTRDLLVSSPICCFMSH